MNFKKLQVLSVVLLTLFMISSAYAQVTLPRVSPRQSVMHTIGLSTVQIDYHSPRVNNRKIWGGIVAYGMNPGVAFGSGNEFPWRAGANENTIITFSDDVKINGKSLKAGSYGFHILPGEDQFTLIFSNDVSSWGSFFYDQSEDALRVITKPVEAPFREWLSYGFDDFTANSAEGYLHWEKLKIPFKIEVDLNKVVITSLRNELRSTPGFGWQGLNQAANWCVQNKVNQEEALQWIEKSIQRNSNFNNLSTKGQLLTQLNRTKEADELMASAIEGANEAQLNIYGYQLMGQGRIDEAISMFRLNLDRHPESWNAHDSLGEGLANKGEKSEAIKYYKKAHEMAPEAQKSRIEGILKNL